jgi:hypothetical protein
MNKVIWVIQLWDSAPLAAYSTREMAKSRVAVECNGENGEDFGYFIVECPLDDPNADLNS